MRDYVRWYATCHDAGTLVGYGGTVANFATGDGVAELEIRAALSRTATKDDHRLKLKWLEEAEKGSRPVTGERPYGYEKGYGTVREEEAAIIREAARRVLAGEPVNGTPTTSTGVGCGAPQGPG